MKEIEYIFQEIFDTHKCDVSVRYQLISGGTFSKKPIKGINYKYYSIQIEKIEKDITTISEIFNIIRVIKEIHNIDFTIVVLDGGMISINLTYLDVSNPITVTKLDTIYQEITENKIESEYDGKVIKVYKRYVNYNSLHTKYIEYITESLNQL